MERITKPMRIVRQQWALDVFLPIVIFSVTALVSVMLLLMILPQDFKEFLDKLVLTLMSLNLGLIALNLYYVEWRRLRDLESDGLAVRLLLLLSVWLIHNLFLVFPVIMGQDTLIWNHQANNGIPNLLHYIALMMIQFVWGSLNMRAWRYFDEDTPKFIRLAVYNSQLVFVVSLIPVMLWSFTSLVCACS
ncbi:MAG: hypothetical protein RLP44_29215 [Aggregatilineales bacterium]